MFAVCCLLFVHAAGCALTDSPKCRLTRPPNGWKPEPDTLSFDGTGEPCEGVDGSRLTRGILSFFNLFLPLHVSVSFRSIVG